MPDRPVRPSRLRLSPLAALVRGLASLVVLAVLAAGVPTSLVRHVGRPWPVRLPPLDELRRRVEAGEVRGMLIVALASIVWLAWLRLMVAVLVEVVARAVRRVRRGTPSTFTTLASGLVTGVSLLALVFPSRSAAAVRPVSVPAEQPVATPAAPVRSAAPTASAIELRREPGVLDGWRSAPFLAAGTVGALEAARRRHLRSAPAGSVVPALPEALARLEAGVRAAAPTTGRDRLRDFAALWSGAVDHAAPVAPVAALVGTEADDVTVLFAVPAPAPPPGWVAAGPDRWRRRVDTRPAGGPPALTSGSMALLPVGRCAGADLYLDVTATGPIRVEAAPAVAERVERAMRAAAELSPLGWPDATEVVAPSGGSGMRLTVAAGRWRLEPLGIVLEPFGLEHQDLDSVRALLAAVADPVASGPASPSAGGTVPAPAITGWSFLVRVLGPLDVIGVDDRTVEFERAKAQELIAWLALHRRRAGREAARTALWDQDVRDTTFANVVSEARRALNRHLVPGDGGDWLGRPSGEQLPLHPEVWCDAEVFEHLFATARRRPGSPEAVAALQQALALVRGTPFAGAAFAWADAEGITSSLTLLVVSAAADLAEAHLALGDLDGTFAATAVGLGLVPGHEELVALRLRAQAHGGDLAGVRHEWEAYERVLAADRWHCEPSPRLVDLRDALLAPVTASR